MHSSHLSEDPDEDDDGDGDNDDDDGDNDNEKEKDDLNDVSGEGCCPSRARWPGYRHHRTAGKVNLRLHHRTLT